MNSAICQGSPVAHLAIWQRVFASIVGSGGVLLLVAALFARRFANWFVAKGTTLLMPDSASIVLRSASTVSIQRGPLFMALARGILHPKYF